MPLLPALAGAVMQPASIACARAAIAAGESARAPAAASGKSEYSGSAGQFGVEPSWLQAEAATTPTAMAMSAKLRAENGLFI